MGLGKIALKLFRSRMVNDNSKKLFSFATKHSLFDKSGEFSQDGLVLVHLTDFAPTEGIIKTAKDAIGHTRNSVHFAVNHAVVSHGMGNWSARKYAVIMPFESTVKKKGNKIIGGVATDLYSRGSIKIPKGSVIVRHNANIPKGKYRVVDSSKIEEFKKLKGIKVIESSEENMPKVTDDIITKLGYETKSTSFPLRWGKEYGDNNGYEMLDKFNKFLKRHKMKPMFHSYTPNGRIEAICENLGFRAGHSNTWIVKDKNGEIILNYKDKYIKILEDIVENAKTHNYKSEYDISKLIEIINNSKTPKDAERTILKCFNLDRLTTECNGVINEYTLYQHLIKADFDKSIISKLDEYIQKPSERLEKWVTRLAQDDQLRFFSSKHLFDIGACELLGKVKNNEIANQLYRLI